jgi:hypothetical protein
MNVHPMMSGDVTKPNGPFGGAQMIVRYSS